MRKVVMFKRKITLLLVYSSSTNVPGLTLDPGNWIWTPRCWFLWVYLQDPPLQTPKTSPKPADPSSFAQENKFGWQNWRKMLVLIVDIQLLPMELPGGNETLVRRILAGHQKGKKEQNWCWKKIHKGKYVVKFWFWDLSFLSAAFRTSPRSSLLVPWHGWR